MSATARLEHLEPIYELNRSFLGFLKSRARVNRDCLGLPESVRPVLRDADDGFLQSVAQVPRALFQLKCERAAEATCDSALARERDVLYHDLTLSILWTSRQTSRESPYQAQFLLGLDVAQIEWLRSLALTDLPRLAGVADIVRCAFPERDWLWRTLLTDTRPESRRQLALVALQPGLARDWPRRRPPHGVN
jgi:hypothetical protein